MTNETYMERVGRWRIERHTELPEEHKAAYREDGIDPDQLWSLVWSFDTEDAAIEKLAQLNAAGSPVNVYRMIDAGAPALIERRAW